MKRLFIIICFLFFLLVPVAQAQSTFKVLKVVDGDTIQVDVRGQKEVVRLLAIDTPESVDPRKPVQCFASEATKKMKSFVEGKSVILIDDRTQGNRDKYGRLLRYVYLPDSVRTFVNGEMVKQGYAFSYKKYPTKVLSKFNNFERTAREKSLGLWGACPAQTKANIDPTGIIKKPAKTNSVVNTSVASDGFGCNGKTLCGQMTNCEEARYYLTRCGVSRLDGDKDGTPCESICR